MQIQNPEVGQELREEANLTLFEVANLSISPNVQAVLNVNPKPRVLVSNLAQSGTGSTSLAAKSNTNFLVHAIRFEVIKDATCDVADGTLQVLGTINGVSTRIAEIAVLTLTAQNSNHTLAFPKPIKLDSNTAITLSSSSFTAGKMRRNCIVYYSEQITT